MYLMVQDLQTNWEIKHLEITKLNRKEVSFYAKVLIIVLAWQKIKIFIIIISILHNKGIITLGL